MPQPISWFAAGSFSLSVSFGSDETVTPLRPSCNVAAVRRMSISGTANRLIPRVPRSTFSGQKETPEYAQSFLTEQSWLDRLDRAAAGTRRHRWRPRGLEARLHPERRCRGREPAGAH